MIEPEHKSCPFCGEDFAIEARKFTEYQECDGEVKTIGFHWSVVCPYCGTEGPATESEEEAWDIWDSGWHGEREDYAEAYRRVGHDVYMERLKREGIING